uniref:Uncharacterized protein n=1 Tax=Hanusia phi TaxID=3032 RepID=A0A7S0HM27_9CRYP|mmetsp:Transcript_2433/g.5797  ORF Transcript_2433/g.5797 Transcript_2433/m.5797 type:complete len:283 (+) Transcript_2433:368-1216(+)
MGVGGATADRQPLSCIDKAGASSEQNEKIVECTEASASSTEPDVEVRACIKRSSYQSWQMQRGIPYKKRKLVVERKSVKFSDSSHLRIVPSFKRTDEEGTFPLNLAESQCTHGDEDAEKSQANACEGDGTGFFLEEDDVQTKDADGPNVVGLITNSLIMGLVDKSVRDVDSVIGKIQHVMEQQLGGRGQESVDGYDVATDMSSDGSPSRRPVQSNILKMVVNRLEGLIDHLNVHERVGLLPSTARLSKPFVPALKCLQGSIRTAVKQEREDIVRDECLEDWV